mgnify:FL=1
MDRKGVEELVCYEHRIFRRLSRDLGEVVVPMEVDRAVVRRVLEPVFLNGTERSTGLDEVNTRE